MNDAWEVLERVGVPCGAPSGEKPDLADLATVTAATRDVLACYLELRRIAREKLARVL